MESLKDLVGQLVIGTIAYQWWAHGLLDHERMLVGGVVAVVVLVSLCCKISDMFHSGQALRHPENTER